MNANDNYTTDQCVQIASEIAKECFLLMVKRIPEKLPAVNQPQANAVADACAAIFYEHILANTLKENKNLDAADVLLTNATISILDCLVTHGFSRKGIPL